MRDILYIKQLQLGRRPQEGEAQVYDSNYISKYRENLTQLHRSSEWKYSGSGAAYMQQQNMHEDPSAIEYAVSDLCGFDKDHFLYAVSAGKVSGIMKKSYADGQENHLLHSNTERFYSLDYHPAAGKVLACIATDYETRDIALYDIGTNDLKKLTEGDSVDERPSFSKADGKIYFSSRGIARNGSMQFVQVSDSTIYEITESGGVEEILAETGYDLIAPKNDGAGNLYYIKKPHKVKKPKNFFRTLLDVLLIPFWLALGLVKILVFLSNLAKKSTVKDKQRTQGNNPAMGVKKSERELFVFQEHINIEKEERKNKKKDKEAGFAPKSFELWKRPLNGPPEKLQDGVLDYDVAKDGAMIVTNGKYVFELCEEGRRALWKDHMITRIKFQDEGVFLTHSDPFDL